MFLSYEISLKNLNVWLLKKKEEKKEEERRGEATLLCSQVGWWGSTSQLLPRPAPWSRPDLSRHITALGS